MLSLSIGTWCHILVILCSYAAIEADSNSNNTLEQRAVLAESRRWVIADVFPFILFQFDTCYADISVLFAEHFQSVFHFVIPHILERFSWPIPEF